jgi:hypothetical protein
VPRESQSTPSTPTKAAPSSRLTVLTGPSKRLTSSSDLTHVRHAATTTTTTAPPVSPSSNDVESSCLKCCVQRKLPTQKVCMECGERFPGAGPVKPQQLQQQQRQLPKTFDLPNRARSVTTDNNCDTSAFSSSVPTSPPQRLIAPSLASSSYYCANCNAPNRTETQNVSFECGVRFGASSGRVPMAGDDATTTAFSAATSSYGQPMDASSQHV